MGTVPGLPAGSGRAPWFSAIQKADTGSHNRTCVTAVGGLDRSPAIQFDVLRVPGESSLASKKIGIQSGSEVAVSRV